MSSSKGLRQRREALSQRAEIASRDLSRHGPSPARTALGLPDRVRPSKPGADRFWRDARRRRILAVADVSAAALASLVAGLSSTSAVWALLLLPVWPVIAQLLGLYDRDQRSLRHLTIDEFGTIAAWAAAGVAVLGIVLS